MWIVWWLDKKLHLSEKGLLQFESWIKVSWNIVDYNIKYWPKMLYFMNVFVV